MTIDVRIINCCDCKQPKIKCRLCLTGNVELSQIFLYSGDDTLTKKIFTCSGIMIEPDDSYSTMICVQCKMDLYKLTQFRTMIIENDQRIKRFLGQRQVEEMTEYADPPPRIPNRPKPNQSAAKRRKFSDENSNHISKEDEVGSSESSEKSFRRPSSKLTKRQSLDVQKKPYKDANNRLVSLDSLVSPQKSSKELPVNPPPTPKRRIAVTSSSSNNSLNETYSCNCCSVNFTVLTDFEQHKKSLAHRYYMGEDVDYMPNGITKNVDIEINKDTCKNADVVPVPVIIKTEVVNRDERNSDDSSINLDVIRRGRKKKIADDSSIGSDKRSEIEIGDNKETIFCGHCKKTFKNSQEMAKAHIDLRKLYIRISPEEQENAMLEYYAQAGTDLFSIVSDDEETVIN